MSLLFWRTQQADAKKYGMKHDETQLRPMESWNAMHGTSIAHAEIPCSHLHMRNRKQHVLIMCCQTVRTMKYPTVHARFEAGLHCYFSILAGNRCNCRPCFVHNLNRNFRAGPSLILAMPTPGLFGKFLGVRPNGFNKVTSKTARPPSIRFLGAGRRAFSVPRSAENCWLMWEHQVGNNCHS